jgi:hypothetical protein
MGLPVSQRKSLDRIESSLRESDPQLAGLFTIFSRLHRDEDMPRLEQLKAGLAWLHLWLRLRPAAARRWLRSAPPRARLRAALFFPAALAIMACSFWLGGLSSTTRCTSVPRSAAITQLIAAGKAKTKAFTRPRGKTRIVPICGPVRWPAAR